MYSTYMRYGVGKARVQEFTARLATVTDAKGRNGVWPVVALMAMLVGCQQSPHASTSATGSDTPGATDARWSALADHSRSTLQLAELRPERTQHGLPAYELESGAVIHPTGGFYLKLPAEAVGVVSEVNRLLRAVGLDDAEALKVPRWLYVEGAAANAVALEYELLNAALFERVVPSRLVRRELYDLKPARTNDPYFADQWRFHNDGSGKTQDGKGSIDGNDHAHIAEAWQLLLQYNRAASVGQLGRDIKLAVIDDGFDLAHEDLDDKYIASRNFGGPVMEGNLFSLDTPRNFHGTLVTGIAVAETDNGVGVAGACPGCALIAGRIAGSDADPDVMPDRYYSDVFTWAIEQGAQVINSSWGPDKSLPNDYFDDLMDWVTTGAHGGTGAVAVFASGNSGEDFSWNGFASHPRVIAVGASNSRGGRFGFSNYGSALDLLAPSSGGEKRGGGFGGTSYVDRIWATDNYVRPDCLTDGKTPSSGCSDRAGWTPNHPMAGGDGWDGRYSYRFSHTSAAAPVVSGVAALVLAANPRLSAAQVRAVLIGTADRVSANDANYDAQGHSTHYGFGRVNAVRAVAHALLLAGETLDTGTRNDIDTASPCTRSDCWDLDAPPGPPPSSDDAGVPTPPGNNDAGTTPEPEPEPEPEPTMDAGAPSPGTDPSEPPLMEPPVDDPSESMDAGADSPPMLSGDSGRAARGGCSVSSAGQSAPPLPAGSVVFASTLLLLGARRRRSRRGH